MNYYTEEQMIEAFVRGWAAGIYRGNYSRDIDRLTRKTASRRGRSWLRGIEPEKQAESYEVTD